MILHNVIRNDGLTSWPRESRQINRIHT